MTVTIELAKGRTALVDDCDKDLAAFRWSAPDRPNNQTQYCIGHCEKKTRYMHRVILARMLGRELTRQEQVDHINGIGTDNRRCNLRLASRKLNIGNSRKHINSKNPYKGVHKSSNPKKPFSASAFIDGKSKSLGSYKTAELAHRAYCIAAIRYWGKFANFGENSPFKGMTIQEILSWKQTEFPVHEIAPTVPRTRTNQTRIEYVEPFVMPDKEWLEPLPEKKAS